MAVREVVLIGDARLRQVAQAVDPTRHDWRQDAMDLADTLTDLKARLGFGRGLAGPQIGSPWRLIAFDCRLGTFVAVNPRITWRSDETFSVLDDCFSIPGRKVPVMRSRAVTFECLDLDGQIHGFECLEPDLAELVQHEVDHLDGILMVDRVQAEALEHHAKS
ncbi:peptide deformylase [Mesorhizobium sp. UC22_110]|jgi:peptide deformylase|uniref:peptide deformylase n=1 Tax=unclassified Mesorhizobium TaxID=325217 RepID=UPI003670DF44